MNPILESPYRSPMVVVDLMKDIIKDKVVCDLGCAYGDIMIEMGKYAKKVIGIELYNDRVDIAKKRGLDVVQGDIILDKIPEAEVYYMWVVHHIIHKVLKRIPKGILILGADPIVGEDIAIKDLHLNGEWREVNYNEGEGNRQHGIFKLFITEIKEKVT